MMMEKEIEEKIKEMISEQGVKVSGMGILAENTKEMIKILNKINNTLIHTENKVEALLDTEAQKRLERLKQRF